MKGVIIAAGSCTRLRPLTDEIPKCLLKINGKSILQNTLDNFNNNGIKDIAIIRGYKREKINVPGITYFENVEYEKNNILHSLMAARSKIEESIAQNEEIVITYSDIWFEDSVVKALLESNQDIASIVDIEWQEYYENRTEHPISEAENVVMDDDLRMLRIGKHVITNDIPMNRQGEFIGLWKFTPDGSRIFLNHFDRLNADLESTTPWDVRIRESIATTTTQVLTPASKKYLEMGSMTIVMERSTETWRTASPSPRR